MVRLISAEKALKKERERREKEKRLGIVAKQGKPVENILAVVRERIKKAKEEGFNFEE